MRFFFPFARRLLLIGLIGLGAASSPAAFSDALPGPARRVQIQCVAIRARVDDSDAMGINFSFLPSDSRFNAFGLRLSAPSSRHWAQIASGQIVVTMLDLLARGHSATFTAPVMVTADGHPGVISLEKMNDPGMTTKPWLVVIPHVREDGAITLFAAPQFPFVYVPSAEKNADLVSFEPFPVWRTVPNGGTMVFTESLPPAPSRGPFFRAGLPIVFPAAYHITSNNDTQLWIFLTAALLPDTPAVP